MTTEKKTPNIVFAPGCFDSFEGTQEELDELVAEIKASIESGEFIDNAIPIEDLLDEDLSELLEHLEVFEQTNRTIQ